MSGSCALASRENPELAGSGPTRELHTTITVVDASDDLVGDVHFAWVARDKQP
jgi:hypothetical protein